VIVNPFTVGLLEENTYLLVDDATGAAVLVDPGDEGDVILAGVEASGARLEAIWVTHGHLDHVGAIAAVKRAWDVPIHLHPLDEPLYRTAWKQAEYYGIPFEQPPAADQEFAEGGSVTVGTLTFEVMHAPGHAPGHVVLHGHGIALVGDVLFAGSVGRTDLPLSNPAHLTASLRKLSALPAETIVYPGHGPTTTIGRELATNPFLTGAARVLNG
jgi:glyoxylase-like metal-dependent hydrolase (beta-lactamase superfamily II)